MELHNEFRVPVPVDRAWEVLTDVERIAPCLPGAQLLSVDGGTFTLAVTVKVGPITARYRGTAEFAERDADAHRAVIRAVGRETRGQGNASALVTAVLSADGDGTAVRLDTDLTVSGKAAQFGRGVLADVSGKLIDRFARNLEADLAAGEAEPVLVVAAPEVSAAPVAVAAPPAPPTPAPPVDVLGTAALPVAKRVVPVVAVLVVALVLLRRATRGRYAS